MGVKDKESAVGQIMDITVSLSASGARASVTGKFKIQGVVDEVNGKFARVENIRKFVLLEKELDHDDGELTATQKVRRGLINKKFARELEIIYGGAA